MGGVNGQYDPMGQSQNNRPRIDQGFVYGVPNLMAGGSYKVNPYEQIQPESTHPEAIAQGMATGVSNIASGLMSGYMAKAKAAKSPQAQQQMQLGYSSPSQASPFGQQASQMPSAYYGQPNFNSVSNTGLGLNFVGNPFFQ